MLKFMQMLAFKEARFHRRPVTVFRGREAWTYNERGFCTGVHK